MLESKPMGKMLMLVAWVLLAAGIGLLWHRSGGKARVDAQRWADLEGKLETLAGRVDQTAKQVDAIGKKFAALAGSVDTIARQFNELQTALQTAGVGEDEIQEVMCMFASLRSEVVQL